MYTSTVFIMHNLFGYKFVFINTISRTPRGFILLQRMQKLFFTRILQYLTGLNRMFYNVLDVFQNTTFENMCVCVCEAINRLCVWHTSCHSSNFPVQYMRKTSVVSNWLNVHTRIKYYVSCTFLFFFFTRRIFFDKFGRKVFMFLKRIK